MTEMIEYRERDVPAADQLADLYGSVDWLTGAPPEDLHAAVRQSAWVATAWHEGRLVGLARALTDGVFVTFFQELLVHPGFRHQGVGKELLDRYDQHFAHIQNQVAVTEDEWARQKLAKRGFQAEPAALTRSQTGAVWG